MPVLGLTAEFAHQIAVDEPFVPNRSFHHKSGFGGYEAVSESRNNLLETTRVMNHTAPGMVMGERRAEADREVAELIEHPDGLAAHTTSLEWIAPVPPEVARKLTFFLMVILQHHRIPAWDKLSQLALHAESKYVKDPYRTFIRRFFLDHVHSFPTTSEGETAEVICKRINHTTILFRVKEGLRHFSMRILTHSDDWVVLGVQRLYPWFDNSRSAPFPTTFCWMPSELGDNIEDFMRKLKYPEVANTGARLPEGGILARKTPSDYTTYEFFFNTETGRNVSGIKRQLNGVDMPFGPISTFLSWEVTPDTTEVMPADYINHLVGDDTTDDRSPLLRAQDARYLVNEWDNCHPYTKYPTAQALLHHLLLTIFSEEEDGRGVGGLRDVTLEHRTVCQATEWLPTQAFDIGQRRSETVRDIPTYRYKKRHEVFKTPRGWLRVAVMNPLLPVPLYPDQDLLRQRTEAGQPILSEADLYRALDAEGRSHRRQHGFSDMPVFSAEYVLNVQNAMRDMNL